MITIYKVSREYPYGEPEDLAHFTSKENAESFKAELEEDEEEGYEEYYSYYVWGVNVYEDFE